VGQGLFIARKVAEAHGGYLTVRSTPGVGSVFTLVLPAA
jgi:signal transduction histidine kinase